MQIYDGFEIIPTIAQFCTIFFNSDPDQSIFGGFENEIDFWSWKDLELYWNNKFDYSEELAFDPPLLATRTIWSILSISLEFLVLEFLASFMKAIFSSEMGHL